MLEILYYIGYFTLFLFIIQTILLLTGGDMDGSDLDTGDGTETDFDTDESTLFGYLSWKNLINFMALFSWTTIGLLEAKVTFYLAVAGGIGAGFMFVAMMILLWKAIASLSEDGSQNIAELSKGKTGIVTIPIDTTDGKIKATIGDRNIVGRARSANGKKIAASTVVRIISYENGIFSVEKAVNV